MSSIRDFINLGNSVPLIQLAAVELITSAIESRSTAETAPCPVCRHDCCRRVANVSASNNTLSIDSAPHNHVITVPGAFCAARLAISNSVNKNPTAKMHQSHRFPKAIGVKRLPPPVKAVKPSPGQMDLLE